MNFETVDKAAERLGVTVRAIQKWAKEGKIPYSHKVGRDWLIPTDAVKPTDKTVLSKNHLSDASFPLMGSYTGGSITEYISRLKTKEERDMARCEYYYYKACMKECTIEAEPYMDSADPTVRSVASLYCMFSNLCRGFLNKSYYASEIMKETLLKSLEDERDKGSAAVVVLSCLMAKLQLQLPLDGVPHIREYIKYLDGGLLLIGCYLMAYDEYLEKNYAKALGYADLALKLKKETYVIPEIYLHLVSAMAHINLMEKEEAKKSVEKARELADEEEIIMPFVEHYNVLGGLIENSFKKEYTEYYEKIIALAKQYNHSWYQVYNSRADRLVATTLNHSEFTIAMLYSRNWRIKEIAAHMHLSERTVTNYISYIYDKLQINSKKELEKYMLR